MALGFAGGGWLAAAAQEKGAAVGGRLIDVTTRGAKGDGKTDDTKAIQAAIDEAGKAGGAVFVPPGIYQASELQLRSNVGLYGIAGWDYRHSGGSVIRLADAKAKCLLNISGTSGVTIEGLALAGANLGSGIHGILVDKPALGRQEDSFRIQTCQIAWFTGDGLSLKYAWAWCIRHSMVAFNAGDGIRLLGYDSFISDCWLSGNKGAGLGARGNNGMAMLTGNRIEWNLHGIYAESGNSYNVTGNCIDRNSQYGLAVLPQEGHGSAHWTITGNHFRGSGRVADADTYESSQIRLEKVTGATVVGNSLRCERGGGRGGATTRFFPSYGIVYQGLSNSVIANNVLHQCAVKQLLVDLGGHGEGAVIKDNPGSLVRA